MPNDYQGLGLYEPPPGKSSRLVLVSVIAAVLVIAGVAALLFVRVTSPTAGEALPVQGAASTTKPKDPLQPRASSTPKVPGWQVMPIADSNKGYDVPPNGWQAVGNGLITFGDNYELSLIAPMVYKHGHCAESPKSWRAMAGFVVMPNKSDINVGAAAAAQQIANTVFTTKARVQPETEIDDPQPVIVVKNTKAVVVTAKLTVPVTAQDVCAAKSVTVVVMMAEPNNPGDSESGVMVAMGDRDVPDAVSEDDLKKIVTSLHFL